MSAASSGFGRRARNGRTDAMAGFYLRLPPAAYRLPGSRAQVPRVRWTGGGYSPSAGPRPGRGGAAGGGDVGAARPGRHLAAQARGVRRGCRGAEPAPWPRGLASTPRRPGTARGVPSTSARPGTTAVGPRPAGGVRARGCRAGGAAGSGRAPAAPRPCARSGSWPSCGSARTCSSTVSSRRRGRRCISPSGTISDSQQDGVGQRLGRVVEPRAVGVERVERRLELVRHVVGHLRADVAKQPRRAQRPEGPRGLARAQDLVELLHQPRRGALLDLGLVDRNRS